MDNEQQNIDDKSNIIFKNKISLNPQSNEEIEFKRDFKRDFTKKLSIRKEYIKNKHNLLNFSDEELIKEYFVEIFSWTVMDKYILNDIKKVIDDIFCSSKLDKDYDEDDDNIITQIKKLNNITILDPCSGNSFHTYLFHKYLLMPVITIDIQPEENAWIDTIEGDGLEYIINMKDHTNKILFLSWIDYTHNELSYNLLTNFKGNMVISVGNYREIDCKKYMDELNNKYKLIKEYYCTMPWGVVEEIKIYSKC